MFLWSSFGSLHICVIVIMIMMIIQNTPYHHHHLGLAGAPLMKTTGSFLTLNQMNFSGGSAALVATFKITIEHCLHVYHNLSNHHKTLHCLHLYHRIGHFNALALLRVARNPSSVGCPTPNTGNPFTWIRNKRVQLKIHKVYQIHQQGNKSLLKPLNLHLFTKSSQNS